jgi:hypothetical protein
MHDRITRPAAVLTQVAALLRRLLVIAGLMFWTGGFTFYAAIVVPIGTDVLGSAAAQGQITRQVAARINQSGIVALAVFALDIAVTRSKRGLKIGRWAAWLGMVAIMVALMMLYPHLDHMFHGEIAQFDNAAERAAFRPWHRLYLWTISVQWGIAVLFALLTLAAWRSADVRESLK